MLQHGREARGDVVVLQGKIGYDSGGYVAFELVDPVAYYGGCQKRAVSEYPVPAHREVMLAFVVFVCIQCQEPAILESVFSDFFSNPLI